MRDSLAYTDKFAYGNANGDRGWLQLVSRSGHAYSASQSGWRLLSCRRQLLHHGRPHGGYSRL